MDNDLHTDSVSILSIDLFHDPKLNKNPRRFGRVHRIVKDNIPWSIFTQDYRIDSSTDFLPEIIRDYCVYYSALFLI